MASILLMEMLSASDSLYDLSTKVSTVNGTCSANDAIKKPS